MLSSILFATAWVLSASAASLQVINGITPNPNNVGFYAYVPASLAQPPPLILAIHYCTGTAAAYYTNTAYAPLADQHGYIVIYPNCEPELHRDFSSLTVLKISMLVHSTKSIQLRAMVVVGT